jgi:hypothetical protein
MRSGDHDEELWKSREENQALGDALASVAESRIG